MTHEEDAKMKRVHTIAALALIGGLIGGSASSWLLGPRMVIAAPENGQHHKVLTAEKFVLVDAEGTVRATLGKTAEKPTGLQVYDANGSRRALLGVTDEGSTYLYFYGKDRRPRVSLATFWKGSPAFELRDAKGRIRVRLVASVPSTMGGVSEGGITSLKLGDDTGLGLELSVLGNIASSVRFFDDKKRERPTAWLGISRIRGMFLVGSDVNGKERIGLGVSKENQPFLRMLDDDYEVVFQAPGNPSEDE